MKNVLKSISESAFKHRKYLLAAGALYAASVLLQKFAVANYNDGREKGCSALAAVMFDPRMQVSCKLVDNKLHLTSPFVKDTQNVE